jgi:type I restriction enzyme S subunit
MNNEMAVIWSLIPPLTEQNQIAAYLDYKTNHIDTLITNKEKLIGLLKEERTAIINQAVTKGINPNAKLKPSGIEWLGDVPQNWEVTRLKRIIDDIFLGLTSKVDYVDNENLGVPLIRAGNLFGGKLDLTDLRYISFEQHKTLTKYRKVKKGDVLVTKSGSIGVCAILESDGEFSLYESVFAIRPTKEKLSSTYLLLLLNSQFLKEQYLSEMVGMGVSHLNMSDMKNTFIFLPNINEQTEIIDYVEFEKKRIDTIITKTEQEIELMKEYKTALISEVVTGKVDVRDEVIE